MITCKVNRTRMKENFQARTTLLVMRLLLTVLQSLLQQSAFTCLRHVLGDDESAASSAVRRRIVSSLDSCFSLLTSSVDAAHCRIVHNVAASFISLLSRLVATADISLTLKVFSLITFQLLIVS